MSLADALSIAMSGLRVNQATMSLVSSNVANAETPGYVRKTADQVVTNTGSTGTGVQINGINRELDQYIQAQLRTETSGAAYAQMKSDVLQQLQTTYGDPNSTSTLESAFNTFTTAVQALDTSPDDSSARIGVINAAQSLASQLNSMSNSVQTLRTTAETGLSDSVTTANNLLQQIATINNQVRTNPLGGTSTDSATASLLDQRDQAISQLAQLMDIRVVTDPTTNQTQVFTGAGVQLVGNQAATLTFNAQGTVTPGTTWNPNTALSQLGSVRVSYADGSSIDLTSTLKSGKMAAYIELRDKTLVQAQSQLDQFAAAMASSLSDKTTAGTATTSGTQSGFNLDLTGLQAGNTINITYTDAATNSQRTVTIMRVDDPKALPLSDTVTPDPNDKVVGIDFSGQSGSIVSQLNAALNASNLQFSGTNPNLTVLNNPNFSTINAASVTTTVTSLTGGSAEVPLFTDNGAAYTGAIGANGSQMTGLAQRISVNAGLVADPSRLVVYSTSPQTAAGDTTRADFLTKQLTTTRYLYSPATGVGSSGAPYSGSLESYLQQFVGQQGSAASSAQQLSDGQNVVLNTLQQKYSTNSGVNMDDEMAHLLQLQNAYSANARVMSTVNQMYQALMQTL